MLSYSELGDAHALEHAGLEAAPRLARVVEDDGAVLFTYKQGDGYMDDGNTLHTG